MRPAFAHASTHPGVVDSDGAASGCGVVAGGARWDENGLAITDPSVPLAAAEAQAAGCVGQLCSAKWDFNLYSRCVGSC